MVLVVFQARSDVAVWWPAAGHKSGKQIVEILQKKSKDYTEEELSHMKHVRAYNKRHLAQGPSKDIEHSKWRYSLMNWSVPVLFHMSNFKPSSSCVQPRQKRDVWQNAICLLPDSFLRIDG